MFRSLVQRSGDTGRLTPILVILLALVLSLLPRFGAAATMSDTTRPARMARSIEVEGEGQVADSFTDPIYGWSIAWDPAIWEIFSSGSTAVNEDGSFGGAVILASDEAGGVQIAGFPTDDGDAEECLDAAVAPREGFAEYEPVEDDIADIALPAASRDAARGLYQIANGQVTYIECRTLVEAEAVLEITWYAGEPDSYEEALPLFDDLMAGLDLSDVHPGEGNVLDD
jgi:hypothetical protein